MTRLALLLSALLLGAQYGGPWSGHVVVQTTPTTIQPAPGVGTVTLYNYGTSPVCCVWSNADGGGFVAMDGGTMPGPALNGPTPCLLDVQTSGTGTQIPGVGVYRVAPVVGLGGPLTISCVSASAQSTDGGDLRYLQEG